MNNTDKIFIKLKHLVKMESQEDIKEFEFIVWDLASTNDPIIFSRLLGLFDDECHFEEVMYSLVHAIETYPSTIYIPEFLKNIEYYDGKIEWFKTLLYRILNSKEDFELFKSNMYLANAQSLLLFFDLIEKESTHHKEIIKGLRIDLEAQCGKFKVLL